jgi:hypothetical protein
MSVCAVVRSVNGVPSRAAVAPRAIALVAVLESRGDLRPLSGCRVVDPEISARGQRRRGTRKFPQKSYLVSLDSKK